MINGRVLAWMLPNDQVPKQAEGLSAGTKDTFLQILSIRFASSWQRHACSSIVLVEKYLTVWLRARRSETRWHQHLHRMAQCCLRARYQHICQAKAVMPVLPCVFWNSHEPHALAKYLHHFRLRWWVLHALAVHEHVGFDPQLDDFNHQILLRG